MLNYRAIAAPPYLKDIIRNYVVFEGILPDGFIWVHDIIPNLAEFIFFNLCDVSQIFIVNKEKLVLKDSLVSGQHSSFFQANFSGNIKLIGVQIRTPGLSRLFNVPLKYLANNALSLYDLIGIEAKNLCETIIEKQTIEESIQAIENFLIKKLIGSKILPANQTFHHALHLISNSKGSNTIKQLVDGTNISEKTLQRIFINQVGITPKVYSRLYRFNEVIRHFNSHKKLSYDLIGELDYFDQAHFIKEFKSFSGQSPLAYFKYHPGVNEFFSRL